MPSLASILARSLPILGDVPGDYSFARAIASGAFSRETYIRRADNRVSRVFAPQLSPSPPPLSAPFRSLTAKTFVRARFANVRAVIIYLLSHLRNLIANSKGILRGETDGRQKFLILRREFNKDIYARCVVCLCVRVYVRARESYAAA